MRRAHECGGLSKVFACALLGALLRPTAAGDAPEITMNDNDRAIALFAQGGPSTRAFPYNTTGYPYATRAIPQPGKVEDPDGDYKWKPGTYLPNTTGYPKAKRNLTSYPSNGHEGIMVRAFICFVGNDCDGADWDADVSKSYEYAVGDQIQFPIGFSTIYYIAVAQDGDTNEDDPVTVPVQISDIEKPTITCPDPFSQKTEQAASDQIGKPTASVNLVASMTTIMDNSVPLLKGSEKTYDTSGLTVTIKNVDTGKALSAGKHDLPIGLNTIEFRVTDTSRKYQRCRVQVTVRDEEKPHVAGQPSGVIRCPLAVSSSWASQLDESTASGVQLSTSPGLSYRLIDLGPEDVQAQDNSGQSLSYKFFINHPLSACDSNENPDDDNCDGYVSEGNHSFRLNKYGPTTRHTIRYEALDRGPLGDGKNPNKGECELSVEITDKERPVLTCPANMGAHKGLATDVGKHYKTINISGSNTRCEDNFGCGDVVARYGSLTGPVVDGDLQLNLSDSGTTVTHRIFFVATDAPCDQCQADKGEYKANTNHPCTSVCVEAAHRTGNTGSCDMNVTVTDAEAPGLECPNNISLGTDCAVGCKKVDGSCSNCSSVGSAYANVDVAKAIVTDNSGLALSYVAFFGEFNGTSAGNVIGQTGTVTNYSYPIGTRTLSYRAEDREGNVGVCTITVTVTDAEDPFLECPNDVTATTVAGKSYRQYNQMWTPRTIKDNSGYGLTPIVKFQTWNTSTSTTVPSGHNVKDRKINGKADFYIGETVIQYSATDVSGRTSTCDVLITIKDEESPVVCCPGEKKTGCPSGGALPKRDVNTDAGVNYTVQVLNGSQATATDNSGVPQAISASIVNGGSLTKITDGSSYKFPIGVTTVRYSSTDESSNVGHCDITVKVADVEPPVLTCPQNITVNTTLSGKAGVSGAPSAVVVLQAAAVTDNSGQALRVYGHTGSKTYNIGTHLESYNATDAAGNTATCTMSVTVEDNETPILTCPPDILFDNAGSTSYMSLSLGKNYSGTYTGFQMQGGKVTQTARSQIGIATVTDNNVLVNAPAVVATAKLAGKVTVVTSGDHRFGCCANSPTVITFTSTDVDGNIGSCQMNVVIRDVVKPVLKCDTIPSAYTCGDKQTCTLCRPASVLPGSSKDCGRFSESKKSSDCNSNSDCTWHAATETCRFKSAKSGCSSINPGDLPYRTFELPGPDISDNSDETLSATATVVSASRIAGSSNNYTYSGGSYIYIGNDKGLPTSGSGSDAIYTDRFYIGQTVVTFTATDSSGNQGSCSTTITVVDNELPVLVGSVTESNGIRYCQSSKYVQYNTDAGSHASLVQLALRTVFDNSGQTGPQAAYESCNPAQKTCSNAIAKDSSNANLLTKLPVLISQLSNGDTLVYFTVADTAGNKDTCVLELRVVDNERPSIICPKDQIVSTQAMNLTGGDYTADSALVVIPSANVTDNSCKTPNYDCNSALILYGNETQSAPTAQVQTVVAAGLPTVKLDTSGGTSVNLYIGATSSTQFFKPYVSDYGYNFKVDGDKKFTAYNITYRAKDAAGNVASCHWSLQVTDNLPPTVKCPDNINKATISGKSYNLVDLPRFKGLGGPSATDNSLPAAQSGTLKPYLVPAPVNGKSSAVQNLCLSAGGTKTSCEQVTGCAFNASDSTCGQSTSSFWAKPINAFVRVQPQASQCGGSAEYANRKRDGCFNGAKCDLDGVCGNSASGRATPIKAHLDIGDHYVFYSVSDTAENLGSCFTVVTVSDMEAPTVHCPASYTGNRVLSTDTGAYYKEVIIDVLRDYTESYAKSDGSPCKPSSETCPHPCQGNTPCVKDNSGVQFSAIPNALESATCPSGSSSNCGGWPFQSSFPSSFEQYHGQPITSGNEKLGQLKQESDSDSNVKTYRYRFPIGITAVTYIAEDGAKLKGKCTQYIQVQDREAPVVKCPTVNVCKNRKSGVLNTCYGDAGADYAEITIFADKDTTVTENSRAGLSKLDAKFTRKWHPDSMKGTANAILGHSGDETLASSEGVGDNHHHFPFGTTVVEYFATDKVGNTGSCTVNLTIIDNEPPIISCPSGLGNNTDVNQSFATISVAVGSVSVLDKNKYDTDLSSAQRAAQDILFAHAEYPLPAKCQQGQESCVPSVDCATGFKNSTDSCAKSPSGAARNCTYSASDGTCKANDLSKCSAADISGSFDASKKACDGAGACNYTNSQCPLGGECRGVGSPCMQQLYTTTNVKFDIGTTTINYVAKDSYGNEGSCAVNVTVLDKQLPTLICPSDRHYNSQPGKSYYEVNVDNHTAFTTVASVEDNSEKDGTDRTARLRASVRPHVNSQALYNATKFQIGTTDVTFHAIDEAGNVGTCPIKVIVKDVEKPAVACPPNKQLYTNPPGSGRPVGDAYSTYAVLHADVEDNSLRNITAIPQIGGYMVNISSPATCTSKTNSKCSQVTALENDQACNAESNCVYTKPTFSHNFTMGNTTVTYIATDVDSNVGTCDMVVTVVDNELPVLTCPAEQALNTDVQQAFSTLKFSGLFADLKVQDNSGEQLAPWTNLYTKQATGTFDIGITNLSFVAQDSSNNVGTCTIKVTVTDNEKPRMSCPLDVHQVTDAGESYATVKMPPAINATCVATNTSIESDVKVCAQVIALSNSTACMSVKGCTYLPNTVIDNSGKNLHDAIVAKLVKSGTVIKNETVNFNLGNTTVSYEATDAAGNTGVCEFTVVITDNQLPGVKCPSNIFVRTDSPQNQARIGSAYATVTLKTAPVTDNSDAVIVAIAKVNSVIVGPNQDVDSRGLPAESKSLSLPEFLYNGASFSGAGVVTNCTGRDSTACGARGGCTYNSTSKACTGQPAGVYSVEYTALDAEGNLGSCKMTVTVMDSEKPVLTCPSNQFIETDLGKRYATVTLKPCPVIDNSNESLVASVSQVSAQREVGKSFTLNWVGDKSQGTHSVPFTYSATDGSDNIGTCSNKVVIQERNDCDCISSRNVWYASIGANNGTDPLCAHAKNKGDSPCVHGKCTDLLGNFSCACEAGWTGYQCDIDIDECASSPCENNATCSDSTTDSSIAIDNFQCACTPRFSGKQCEFLDECSYDPCHKKDGFFVDQDGDTTDPSRFFCAASDVVSSFDGQEFERFICVDPDKTVTGDFYCRCPTCVETIFDNTTVADLSRYLNVHPSMQLHIKGEVRKKANTKGQCVDPSVPRVGCMDSTAVNYDSLANRQEKDSCIPALKGCMNPNATNFKNYATVDDGSCTMNYPNGTQINENECSADPCNSVKYFMTAKGAPVCEEPWVCSDTNVHMLNDYRCTCPQAICGLEEVVPEVSNFGLSIFLHQEHTLKTHLMKQIEQPTTVNGCTCMAAWNASNGNSTACQSGTVYRRCSMTKPCDGNNGGKEGNSWCEVIDAGACKLTGRTWDYCTP